MSANLAVYAPACGLPLARLIAETGAPVPEVQMLAEPAGTCDSSAGKPANGTGPHPDQS